jgi:cell division protein FtsL
MTRLNLILFVTLIFSALGLVNSQHKTRKLYIELEQMNQAAKQYEQEYGLLQLEQSTWAMHSRIEKVAAGQMQMQVPDAKRIQVITLPNTLSGSSRSETQSTLNEHQRLGVSQ